MAKAKAKAVAAKKPMTKSEVLNAMAERTGLSRKEVAAFFDELGGLIQQNLGKKDRVCSTSPA